ncbi:ABC transporter substrate-binding protein [bacterium]|nr:ABC transporter substrate-binding protein [bacterium]
MRNTSWGVFFLKRFICILIVGLTLVTLTACANKKHNENNKFKVAEVTHSVFYAPWYVAIHNGYFEDLDIEVILTSGANNVVAAVLSKDADIGLCGPEATIYANKENKNKVKTFAGLTKRDGQFLVLRKGIKYEDFKSIENLTILAGRSGGMPLLNFKNALKNENIKNVTIDSSIDFANLTSAFIAGTGDGVNLFEPNATTLTKTGKYYIATSIGTYSGVVPYTAFNALESNIKNNESKYKKFYRGIEKGLEYVSTHSSKEIAEIIKDEFPDTNFTDLVAMVDNYKSYDSWLKTPKISEEIMINLENIMIDNNELEETINFNELVYEFN